MSAHILEPTSSLSTTMTTTTATAAMSLPPELILHITSFSHPLDIAHLAQTCHAHHDLVGRQLFWHQLFFSEPDFNDDPYTCLTPLGLPYINPARITKASSSTSIPRLAEDFDWRREVQRRARAELLIKDPTRCTSLAELDTVLETLLDALLNIPAASARYAVHEISRNLVWLAAQRKLGAFIDYWTHSDSQSIHFDSFYNNINTNSSSSSKSEEPKSDADLDGRALPHHTRQSLSRLHTLFGLTSADFRDSQLAQSRSYVYDMRHYAPETSYGPLLPASSHTTASSTNVAASSIYSIYSDSDPDALNQRVNWVHMRAVQHIMAMHTVRPHHEEDGESETKASPLLPYCQAQLSNKKVSEDGFYDWAGVEGAWRCSFAFMDHRELLSFNAQETPPNKARNAEMFEDPAFIEVFRTFIVHLHVTGTTPNAKYPSRPTIQFRGTMHDVHNMRGSVAVGCDDTVRWTFQSGDDGQMIWSSLGIQIGAVQSTFGVLGTWTTVFHDDGDPLGPLWLRKVVEADDGVEGWSFTTDAII